MKKNNKKGFTLAELLIVVAIIAVLVAVAIPIFNAQLEKSRDAVDESNTRAAYGQAVADYLDDGSFENATITLGGQTFSAESVSTTSGTVVKVTMQSGLKSQNDAIQYSCMENGVFQNFSKAS